MSDTIFRTKAEPVPVVESKPIEIKNPSRGDEGSVEVPYMDYATEHNHPYMVDHFKLGDKWDVFSKEVNSIEDYAKSKIESGEIANSVSAIKNLIKGMEKMNNLKNEERPIVKIEVLANYVEFLMKNDKVKENLRRYA